MPNRLTRVRLLTLIWNFKLTTKSDLSKQTWDIQMKYAINVLVLLGCLAIGVFLSCASGIKQQPAQSESVPAPTNLERIAKIAKAATVQIGSLSIEGPPSLGSGFFIGPDLIVTNIHVINQRSFDGAISVAKLVNKPTWYTIKGVIASDPKRDLVILKVTKVSGEDPPILSLGDSDAVKTGDNIVAIGSPRQGDKFVQGDVSKGIISRHTPNFLGIRVRNMRKGYSGGPVLNVRGDVIGITFQSHRIGAGYAIPSNYLRALLDNISNQPKSLEKWREDPLIRYYSAIEAANRGELANAIKDFDVAINLVPDFADAYINRGYARKKMGDLEGAIEDYDTAIHLGEDYAYVYFIRAIAKADSGDKKGAIKDYDSAIRLDAAYTKAYVMRGGVKSYLGDTEGAIKDYNTVIRLKPENTILAMAYVERGSEKFDLGDNNGAIEDSNTAIGLKSVDILLAVAYNIRGKAKSAQGDNEGSIMDYDTAIQLEPNHAEFYYRRGVANAGLGHSSEAETDFKTALKLLEKASSPSKLVNEGTGSSDFELHLTLRPDLKADIEEALRLLK